MRVIPRGILWTLVQDIISNVILPRLLRVLQFSMSAGNSLLGRYQDLWFRQGC